MQGKVPNTQKIYTIIADYLYNYYEQLSCKYFQDKL